MGGGRGWCGDGGATDAGFGSGRRGGRRSDQESQGGFRRDPDRHREEP